MFKQAAASAALSVLVALPLPRPAAAELMVVGLDQKFAFDDAGRRQTLAPGNDRLMVFDLADPAAPRLLGDVPLENSVIGPPTNLAITPDQRLALVANPVHAVSTPEGGWRTVPATQLFVVDLAARPPVLRSTLEVGAQPSGIAISPDGRVALVANREGRSLSVLAIRDQDVRVTATLPMNDVVTSVAITPDGRRALVVKFAAHRVAVLSISPEGELRPDGLDITVGPWPYTVAISPDGRTAMVTNTGNAATSDGNLDTVSVIDLVAVPPRTVDHVVVGDAPEGIVFSPRGGLALATVLNGSFDSPRTAWWRRDRGRVAALRLRDGRAQLAGTLDVGSFPEGIAVSADGGYAYVGNFGSNSISVLRVSAAGDLTDTGRDIALPGRPAALRIGSQ